MKYDVYQTTLYIHKNFKNKKMKIIILLSVLFLSLVSCTSEESNYITVNGRVEREINGEGVANQTVVLDFKQAHGSGQYGTYYTFIESKQVKTDSNGNFSVSVKSADRMFVQVYKEMDDNYSTFELKNFNPTDNIILKVNKFLKFKIFVNNMNPFNENDYIYIDFASGNKQSFRTNIENFGIINIHYPSDITPGAGGTGAFEEASWRGINVNSIVYYNVPENADNHKIVWYKRKNGIETSGVSPEIPFQPNQINEYHFDY